MKNNRLNKVSGIGFVLASAILLGSSLSSCDDNKMEWGLPEGHTSVTAADIPLAVKEVIANYEDVKYYANQYTPNLKVGLGAAAGLMISDENYLNLATDNFQLITFGNAMKMDALVTNAGSFNFETLDAALAKFPSDVSLYGHNFIWHTQQKSDYLLSLIKPKQVIETDDDIQNLLTGDNTDFEGGTTGGWASWGNSSTKEAFTPGHESNYCVHLSNPSDGSDYYVAQFAYTFNEPLESGETYVLQFYAKAGAAGQSVQFCFQNSEDYSGGGYKSFDISTDWTLVKYEFTLDKENMDRILLNFGKYAGEYYIDDIKFGKPVKDPMVNVLTGDDSDFEGGSTGAWASWGNSSTKEAATPGFKSDYCMHLNNPSDGSDYYVAQCAYTFKEALVNGETYILQFYAKAGAAGQSVQFCFQNSEDYSGGGYKSYDINTDWTLVEHEFTLDKDNMNRILINFGKVAGDYYIDNVKFGVKVAKAKRVRPTATKIYYILKTPEEKKSLVLGAMETWIKGVADHLAEKNVVPMGYDVINEPIMDGSNLLRGVDKGVFNGEDTEPVETTQDGLTLNWASGHWYWGYYIGKEYGVKAFQFARKYLPASTKLFINDYNLETSPNKLEALIQFVNDIDAANGAPIVDGIGTQMHLTLDVTSDDDFNTQIANFIARVKQSLTTLAATGKLVRITELDISLGTASPNSTQLRAQYEAYRQIFELYKEIIPENQQSGITIWGLSDSDVEHEYWLKGESPNIFDQNYKRKWAYKGVCDGIAGEDLGIQYGGEDYKAFYEKNNTSDFTE